MLKWLIRNYALCVTFSRSAASDWRVAWSVAQDARKRGDVALVDAACAAVLRENPKFWFARELPKHARGYYSQNGQDVFIERFFERYCPNASIFVEVGAFDGVHYSNVRRLHERRGWTGVCIEPVPENYAKLTESYRGTDVQCVQAAVARTAGTVELYVSSYPHLPDWGSDVATLVDKGRDRWDVYAAQWRVEAVRAAPLTEILANCGLQRCDLLSVDAEGYDLEVLQTLDFNRYTPKLIVVEHGGRAAAIAELLEPHGYAVVRDDGQDLFLAPSHLKWPET